MRNLQDVFVEYKTCRKEEAFFCLLCLDKRQYIYFVYRK